MPMKEIYVLSSGSHAANGHACIMEAAAFVAGEKWSDRPDCVSSIIGDFLRNWNDSIPDDATRTKLLTPLLPLILGTNGSAESELKRSWLAFDWLVRECEPAFMDLTEALKPHAKALRALGPIYDKLTLDAATPTINSARSAAGDAARDAAGDALAPTVLALQNSATELVKRMAEVERMEFKIERSLKINGFEFVAEVA